MNIFEKLENQISIFVIVSMLDFFLTSKFLKNPDFQELNPIANFFNNNYGDLGMLLYKGSIVAIVIAIAIFIERYKQDYGKYILKFACYTTGAVVLYSMILYSIVYL